MTSGALTVLITGFGPFPGAPFNPTGALVKMLLRRRRPAYAGLRLIGHVFHTSYAAVDAELPALIEKHRPDVLLLFGLAARTKFLRIETGARNARSNLFADAAGRLPPTRSIRPGGPSRLVGRAPFAPLLVAARTARVPIRHSHNAGRYLCNYAYWRAAEIAGPHAPRRVLFVHVPKIAKSARPHARVQAPAVTMQGLLRAAEAILRVLVTSARH
jgi:pyroglutamyl-peptidase